MVISIFLSLTWSFDSTISISCLGLSPSLHIAYVELLFWPQAWVRDYHWTHTAYSLFNGRSHFNQPFLVYHVTKLYFILLCVRMLGVGLRPHIYYHILVRLILCARMPAKYLFSNVERGSIPPNTLPLSYAPHSTVRLTLYKGLRPLLSVHDLYP